MIPKDISNYGGVKTNGRPIVSPQTQLDANEWDRAAEDAAQMTRTAYRAVFDFAPGLVPVAGPIDSVWGSGVSQTPSISRSSTGVYVLTWPSTFTDSLGYVEAVAFKHGKGSVNVLGHAIVTVSLNVVTVSLFNLAGAPTDLAGTVTVWLR